MMYPLRLMNERLKEQNLVQLAGAIAVSVNTGMTVNASH
jgi:hypothetical protein